MLEVPTLRGLQQLERVDEEAVVRRRAWGDRQRVVFVLALVALAALGIAGYLAISLPANPRPPVLPEVTAESPLSEVYAVAQDLKTGLSAPPPLLNPLEQAELLKRGKMIWGIKIALAASLCALAAAGVVLLSGRRQKR
jgi:hypothetical protein